MNLREMNLREMSGHTSPYAGLEMFTPAQQAALIALRLHVEQRRRHERAEQRGVLLTLGGIALVSCGGWGLGLWRLGRWLLRGWGL